MEIGLDLLKDSGDIETAEDNKLVLMEEGRKMEQQEEVLKARVPATTPHSSPGGATAFILSRAWAAKSLLTRSYTFYRWCSEMARRSSITDSFANREHETS